LAGSVAAKLSPLQQWHQQHIQRQQQAAVKAQKWWDSRERKAAAVAAATGLAKRKQGIALAAAAVAAAGGGGDTEGMQADSDSSSAELWPNGLHDCNPQCPLCQTELEQQQQQHPAGGSSSSSSSSVSVPYDDPFLWRRLLWRLLGKVSPEAQAFHAHYLNMCPHSCSARYVVAWQRWMAVFMVLLYSCGSLHTAAWHMRKCAVERYEYRSRAHTPRLHLLCLNCFALCSNWHMVVGSLDRCMWASGVDVIEKVLVSPEGLVSGLRTRMLRQYSRVINAAHCKVGSI
jgi:hypothetical protein